MSPPVRISWNAEALRVALRIVNRRPGRRLLPPAKVRKRLRRIEPFVPAPPKGTTTLAFEANGIQAVRIDVPQARRDRCVLFFHGGGYSYGNAPLYQDFMWRVGTAARASVVYFDYRLAPEHP